MELKTLIRTRRGTGDWGLGIAARMLIRPLTVHSLPTAHLTSPQLADSEMVDTTWFSVNLSVRAME